VISNVGKQRSSFSLAAKKSIKGSWHLILVHRLKVARQQNADNKAQLVITAESSGKTSQTSVNLLGPDGDTTSLKKE